MKTVTLDIDQIKEKTLPILKEAGVTRSAIFGSYATGARRKDSDVDILVGLPEGKTLFDFVELKLKLEEALGRKVDLVEYGTVKPRIKDRILAEQVPIL